MFGTTLEIAMLAMSNREPTRWQQNLIYPQPTSLCE